MGKLKGEILLAEAKVRALRKELRRDEKIPRRTKAKMELVFKMALRYIRCAQRFARFHGRYEECYATLAGGISETFYTSDEELAACFGVSPEMIRRWELLYPDFKKRIRAGRRRFINQEGSDVCRQRWFRLRFAAIARNICKEFKPTKNQLARCFKIKARTWKEWNRWMQEYCYAYVWTRLAEIRRRVFFETVQEICEEFNPDDEQLARCMGVDVRDLKKWMETDKEFSNSVRIGRTIASGEMGQLLDKAFAFLPESEKAESET